MNDRLDRMFLSIFVYLLMNGVNDLGEIICDTCVFLIDCCTVYLLFIYLFICNCDKTCDTICSEYY